MSLDHKVFSSIAAGDKVEVHDTENDRVTQGWVERVIVQTLRHTVGTYAGRRCHGEIQFVGDAAGYAYHILDADEVRILVKKPVPPKVGDKIRRPVANDLPVGTIIRSGSDQPWIVLAIDNPNPNTEGARAKIKRFVLMTNYNRTHNFLTAVYTIEKIGDI